MQKYDVILCSMGSVLAIHFKLEVLMLKKIKSWHFENFVE